MNLIEYLTAQKNILSHAEAENWQAAVKLSTDMLVASKAVEPHYYEKILENVRLHGPYFVIAPGIAMPHARPECGVNRTSCSLVTLKTPVMFGHEDNDPVDIILTIAAVDKKALNEDVIVQVVTLFDSDVLVQKIRDAKNTDELISVLKYRDFS